jgi:hypothetical protein
MKKVPLINIRRGKLLEPFLQAYVSANYPNLELPDDAATEEAVTRYRAAWNQEGHLFFEFLETVPGLEFERNTIDCFIVPATPRDMSAPLVVRSRYAGPEFVDVLAHELLHILLTDRDVHVPKEFAREEPGVRNHIFVFAALDEIYRSHFKDAARLESMRKKSLTPGNESYARAWRLVDETGAERLLKILVEQKTAKP